MEEDRHADGEAGDVEECLLQGLVLQVGGFGVS